MLRSAKQRYAPNNTVLSEARARAVQEMLLEVLGAEGNRINVESTGVGDIDPRVHCESSDPDSCHAKNRRVTLRLIGAAGVSFDFSCVGGR
jgi:outer membrane protein OmpA-like peptidoglycan-associated protein